MTTVNIVPSVTDEGKFVSLVEHIPLASYVSFQHGRIDTTVVGHVGSHARRMSFAEGFASASAGESNYKGGRTQSSGGGVTETKTIFAISNHVRVAIPDSAHYSKATTPTDSSKKSEGEDPRYGAVIGASSTCSAIVTISKVGGSSTTLIARVYQEPEGVTPNGIPSSTAEEIVRRATYIGTAAVTMVSIDKATRKSAPIDDDKRKGLISGLNENMVRQWESADRASFKHLEESVMITSPTNGNTPKIDEAAASAANKSIASLILDANRIEVNVPLLMKAATNGKVKMEGAKEVTSPAQVVFLEVEKCTLRPSDFDFNGHLNMNMYVTFCIDALRASLRRGHEQHLARKANGNTTPEKLSHVADDAGLLAVPLGAALIHAVEFHDDCSATYTDIGSTPHRTLVGDIVVNQHEAKAVHESEAGHKDQNANHRVPTVEELVLSSKIEYKQEVTDMNCTIETSIMAAYPLSELAGGHEWRHSASSPWLLKFLVRSVPANGDQKKAFVASLCEMVIAPPPTAY